MHDPDVTLYEPENSNGYTRHPARRRIQDRLQSIAQASLRHLLSFLRFLLFCLRPDCRPSSQPGKVAYLDGLRGVASVLVVLEHTFYFSHMDDVNGLARAPFGQDGQYHLFAFPIVRLFFTGGAFAVNAFFIISGFVISLSPLNKLQSQQYERLANDLGVAFPRRAIRLYIPVLGTTFVQFTCWYLFGGPQRQSWPAEVVSWLQNFFAQSSLFQDSGFWHDYYNGSLWTIAVEVRGSFIVYVALLCAMAFRQRGTTARLCAFLGIIVYYTFLVKDVVFALFIVGMLMCDLQILADNEELPGWVSKFHHVFRRFGGFWLLLPLGVFLSGSPPGIKANYRGWGGLWEIMAHIVPPQIADAERWWTAWGSVFLAISIVHFSALRWVLETRVCQYLGKISFSLYLVHGPLVWGLGRWFYPMVGVASKSKWNIPDVGPYGFELPFVIAQAILTPVLFYLADVCTKFFDEPSVKIARYLCNPLPASARQGYALVAAIPAEEPIGSPRASSSHSSLPSYEIELDEIKDESQHSDRGPLV